MKKQNKFNDLFKTVSAGLDKKNKAKTNHQDEPSMGRDWEFDRTGIREFYQKLEHLGYQRDAQGEGHVVRAVVTTPSRTELTLQRLIRRGNSREQVRRDSEQS